MLTKKIIIPAVAIVLVGGTVFGVSRVNAESASGGPLSGLAQAIAQKFNLNQNDVEAVMDDWHTKQHDQMQQNMQSRLNTKLDQAVKDGKITDTQKQAILNKMSEMKNNFNKDDFKNMTPEERKAEMEKRKADLESWATSQGLDLNNLPMVFGFHGMGMRHLLK